MFNGILDHTIFEFSLHDVLVQVGKLYHVHVVVLNHAVTFEYRYLPKEYPGTRVSFVRGGEEQRDEVRSSYSDEPPF